MSSEQVADVVPPPSLKRNVYAEAADPRRYRVPDAPLFTCAEHTAACVLCTTAGKNGRNGRTAAVGATLFWLTCLNLNAWIARLEGRRSVQAVTDAMNRHARLLEWHVASHAAYATRAQSLLSDAEWVFFESHFLSPEPEQLRKFGNAAVSHAPDMKCLHALAAQTLAGAANPVGSVLLNYLLFVHELTRRAEAELTAAATEGESTGAREQRRARSCALIDSTELFVNFISAFVTAAAEEHEGDWRNLRAATLAVEAPSSSPEMFPALSLSHVWRADTSFAALSPDLCACARRVLTFLEGKPPRRHKKHRIN